MVDELALVSGPAVFAIGDSGAAVTLPKGFGGSSSSEGKLAGAASRAASGGGALARRPHISQAGSPHVFPPPAVAGPAQLRLAHTADPSLLLTLVSSSLASVPSATVGRTLLAAGPNMARAVGEATVAVSGALAGRHKRAPMR